MATPPFRNILLVVDGTESSVKAAEYALRLVQATRGKLVAISVVDVDTLRKLASAHILVEQEMGEFERELERNQRRHLDYVAQRAGKAKVAIETVLRKGVCHSAVLAEQKAIKADVIIMGGFRSSYTKHDLVARERQLILDAAPCPVLVVK